MQLLDPTKIKEQKSASLASGLERIAKLREEETRLTRSTNLLRAQEKEQTEKIDSEFKTKDEQYKQRISENQRAIESLEKRKAMAMVPVKELLEQANQKIENADEMLKGLIVRGQRCEDREVFLKGRAKLIKNARRKLRETERSREAETKKINADKAFIAKERAQLQDEKDAFSSKVTEENKILDEREEQLDIHEKANQDYADSLTLEREKLNQLKRQLDDGRQTLARAWKELMNKQ